MGSLLLPSEGRTFPVVEVPGLGRSFLAPIRGVAGLGWLCQDSRFAYLPCGVCRVKHVSWWSRIKPLPLSHKYLHVTLIASWNMEVRGRPGNNCGILGCTRASRLAVSGAGERLWLL